MSFRKNLEYLRKEKNFSQEELAFKLGVSRQAVSKWESGGAYPETEKMLSMCKIFDCTLDELMNEDIVENKKELERRYSFNDLVQESTEIVRRTLRMFDNMSGRSMFRFLFEIFLLFLFILFLHIPFNYLFGLGSSVFVNIPGDIAQLFISIWHFITELVYLVVAVTTFVYIYKIRFLDKFEEAKEISEKVEEQSETVVKYQEKEDEKKVVEIRKYDFGVFSFIGKVSLFFIKSFIAFISLPIIFLLLCTVVGVVIGVVLMFSGVVFIGMIISMLSVISFCVGVLYMVYNFVVNHRSNWQRLFIVFIASILLFGVGVGISVLEFSKMTISSNDPVSVKTSTKVETFAMKEDLLFQSFPSYIEYVVDDSLTDTIRVEATYYDVFTKDIVMQSDETTGDIYIYSESVNSVDLGKLYDILINDLKVKTFSDYSQLGRVKVRVYTSEENIKKLDEYVQKQNDMYVPLVDEDNNVDVVE
jgi:transcriptional regulator with XRE-family HTH domain